MTKGKSHSAYLKSDELSTENIFLDNEDFNDELDGGDLIEIRSLQNYELLYTYKASEVLYSVDRTAYLDELDNWHSVKLKEIHSNAIHYINESNQEAVFSDLINLIRKRKVAPFIGAGISAAAGYPGWSNALRDLGNKLADIDNSEVEQLLDNEEFLQLAQKLANISRGQLVNHVKTTFRVKSNIESDKSQIPRVIQLLPRLCDGAMVTTNFDTLIEDWFKSNSAPEFDGFLLGLQQKSNFVQKLLKGDRCLLKLHGDASQPDTYIFTEDQYKQGYGEGDIDFRLQLPKALRQVYVSHSLLFLGCSLVQDKTLDLFKQVKDEEQFVIPEHFALLAEPKTEAGHIEHQTKQQTEDRLYAIGIRPIWYPDSDNHAMLISLLELAVEVAENRIGLGI